MCWSSGSDRWSSFSITAYNRVLITITRWRESHFTCHNSLPALKQVNHHTHTLVWPKRMLFHPHSSPSPSYLYSSGAHLFKVVSLFFLLLLFCSSRRREKGGAAARLAPFFSLSLFSPLSRKKIFGSFVCVLEVVLCSWRIFLLFLWNNSYQSEFQHFWKSKWVFFCFEFSRVSHSTLHHQFARWRPLLKQSSPSLGFLSSFNPFSLHWKPPSLWKRKKNLASCFLHLTSP